MKRDNDLEKALKDPQPFVQLRNLVQQWLAQGQDRQMILDRFEQARLPLRTEGREADEDVLLEVMDCLVGWCSPHMKL